MSQGDDAPPPWEGKTGGFQQERQGRGGRRPRQNNEGGDRGDYVEVKDRIALFYQTYPDGRIQTELLIDASTIDVEWETVRKTRGEGADRRQVELQKPSMRGVVTVKASVYRTPDDPRPCVGHSWMAMPGQTPYTEGSELENAETSAVGRALAMAGIAVNKGISSGNEIRMKRQTDDEEEAEAAEAFAKWQAEQAAKEGNQPPAAAPETPPAPEPSLSLAQVPPEQSEQAAPAVDQETGEVMGGPPPGLTAPELAAKMKEYGVGSVVVVAKAKARFGHSNIRSLTDEQRGFLWADCAADLTK